MQLLENKCGVFRLLIGESEYTFYPPSTLCRDTFLPLPAKVKGGTLGWNVEGRFVSYWQIKKCIKTMRTLLLILLPFFTQAQLSKPVKAATHGGIILMGIVAGIADGQREVIVHNKWAYRYRHPNANERWWNPDSTWKRADGGSEIGGSLFAFTKDKYHLNGMIRTAMFTGQWSAAIVLHVDDFKRHKKFRPLRLLLTVVEVNGSYMLAKYATHEFYQLPK